MSSKKTRVGFQGERGAYSEKVVERYFHGEAEAVPCKTFYEVVDQVRSGVLDMGALPVENSIIGCITHSYDLLLESKLNVVGEYILPIKHCLLALSERPTGEFRAVYSHPAALSQCEVFLRRFKDVEIVPVYDTAGSVKMIKERGLEDVAAIASEENAAIYGMKILERGIEDYPHNQTRFMIVANEDLPLDRHQECRPFKTSIVFDTFDQPGTLCGGLGVFEKHQVNLTFLESRPHKTEPWKYHFFVDLQGHTRTPRVAAALDELGKRAEFLHVLGCYPQWVGEFAAGGNECGEDVGEADSGIDPKAPLYSLRRHPSSTVVEVGKAKIGAGGFTVIAGPCSVEGRHQLMETAKMVVSSGALVLRGGAYKPRSSPYSFQGMGEEGLKLLREASREYGVPVVTEVISVETLPLVAEYADILQVGARNMQNFVLLTEVGKLRKPVLLKRGLMATLKELLLSAEYILERGNPDVILCERGIRTFETATRNTLDLSAVPYLKSQSHLPVMVDPSHGTGIATLVPPMVKAALAAGADGVLVEAHFSPSTALCDGEQSLDGKAFKRLMDELRKIAPAFGRGL